MIGLVLVLFRSASEGESLAAKAPALTFLQRWGPALSSSLFTHTITELRRSRLAVGIIALYSFLPVLSYAGLWDSYFSFTLFAEAQAKADIFVTEAYRDRLPIKLIAHVHKVRQAYDPRMQGPYVFDFQAWGYEVMRVPPIFEPRSYRSIFSYLRFWSRKSDDLRMIVAPRAGPMVFYQGDTVWPLTPSKP
jgi:hypothetical protein